MLILILLLVINLLITALIYKYLDFIKKLFVKLKPLVDQAFLYFSVKLQVLAAFFYSIVTKGQETNFRNLTAYAKADLKDPYVKLLDECIRDNDTRNIALTGPYGSGKSSILKSFQLSHPEFHYLNISLASFTSSKKNAEDGTPAPLPANGSAKPAVAGGAPTELEIESIEYSVLQQIFYHVKHQQIPFSRFKRIKNLPAYQLFFRAFCLVLWSVALVYLIWHEKIFVVAANGKDALKNYLQWPPDLLKALLLSFVTVGTVYICFLFMRLYNNSKFRKFNLTSGEVEIAPDDESSILNRHLDELIYFFEATKYNILIIEDMDRFNDPEIFVRLREINNLLNSSKQVGRKISFIYALRDDIFQDEQRTKFFDYIVPVIPFIDYRNSAEQINLRLTQLGIGEDLIPRSFVADVGYYIGDMRLLLNTLNEFQLYREKLDNSPESYIYLLALMIFKNKYPKLFAQLFARKGTAYKVLNGRDGFVDKISVTLLSDIEDLTNKLNLINETFLRDHRELRMVYIAQFIAPLIDFGGDIYIGSQSHNIKTISESALLFDQFTQSTNIKYSRYSRTDANSGVSFKKLENIVDPAASFKKREAEINIRQGYKKEELEQQLEGKQYNLDNMRSYSLGEIFEVTSLAQLEPSLAKIGLLTYLVTNGYLNEDYHLYMSFFYAGSLTRKDMDYFMAVKEGKRPLFDYKLEKTMELVKRLELRDFERPGILNIVLIDEILNSRQSVDKIRRVIIRLSDNSVHSINFIKEYLRLGKKTDRFVHFLAIQWPRFWLWMEVESKFAEEKKKDYLAVVLKNVPFNNLKELNREDALVKRIQSMPDFLSWSQEYLNFEQTTEVIETLEIYFSVLNIQQSKEKLLDWVYNNDRYEMNPWMVELMVYAKGNGTATDETLQTANLTSIMESAMPELMSYIDKYPGYYTDEVFLDMPDNNRESVDAIIYLVNHDELGHDKQKSVLLRSADRIPEIEQINDDNLWLFAMAEQKVKASWPNILAAYNKAENLAEEMTLFLNIEDNYLVLQNTPFDEVDAHEENDFLPLAMEIMLSVKISNNALDHLLHAYTLYFVDPDLKGIDKERVEIILKHDRLNFSVETFQFLQKDYPGLQLIYAENNLEQFFTHLESINLLPLDYRLLLGSEKLSSDQKELLIGTIESEYFEMDKLLALVVANLLEQPDFIEKADIDLLELLFENSDDNDSKKRLLLKYLPGLHIGETALLLKSMKEGFEDLPKYRRPSFEDVDINRELLERLKAKKYFVSTVQLKKGKLISNPKQKPQ